MREQETELAQEHKVSAAEKTLPADGGGGYSEENFSWAPCLHWLFIFPLSFCFVLAVGFLWFGETVSTYVALIISILGFSCGNRASFRVC